MYGCFACTYGHRVDAVPMEAREGVRALELELLMLVSCPLCAGDRSESLAGS